MEAGYRFDHQLLAVEREHHVHCMLELTAPPAPEGAARPTLRLALVLDRSGSMHGGKLEVAKECAAFLARRLSPTDELALVDFDDAVRLLLPLQPVSFEAVANALFRVFPGGETNLSGGWLKGVEALSGAPEDGPRKVLLLTDGQANVGVTDRKTLTKMARGASGDGIGTTTIGFGDGFDEDLLTAMADAAGGNSYYAATPEEAPGIFAAEFEGLVGIVAQNVSVEIRPSDEVKVLGILNDYPQVPVPGGVQVALGDAYGGERRRVVFELHVPSLASLGVAKVADVVVRYVSVGERIEAHQLTIPLTVNLVSSDEAALGEADAEVTEEVVVLKSARAQEEARKRADEGDFEGARELLRRAAEELREIAPGSGKSEELMEQAEETEAFGASMGPADYDPAARKRMRYSSQARMRGRPTDGKGRS